MGREAVLFLRCLDVCAFVALEPVVDDAEGREASVLGAAGTIQLLGGTGDRRRVETAAEHHAQWARCPQPSVYGLEQDLAKVVGIVGTASIAELRWRLQLPVPA